MKYNGKLFMKRKTQLNTIFTSITGYTMFTPKPQIDSTTAPYQETRDPYPQQI